MIIRDFRRVNNRACPAPLASASAQAPQPNRLVLERFLQEWFSDAHPLLSHLMAAQDRMDKNCAHVGLNAQYTRSSLHLLAFLAILAMCDTPRDKKIAIQHALEKADILVLAGDDLQQSCLDDYEAIMSSLWLNNALATLQENLGLKIAVPYDCVAILQRRLHHDYGWPKTSCHSLVVKGDDENIVVTTTLKQKAEWRHVWQREHPIFASRGFWVMSDGYHIHNQQGAEVSGPSLCDTLRRDYDTKFYDETGTDVELYSIPTGAKFHLLMPAPGGDVKKAHSIEGEIDNLPLGVYAVFQDAVLCEGQFRVKGIKVALNTEIEWDHLGAEVKQQQEVQVMRSCSSLPPPNIYVAPFGGKWMTLEAPDVDVKARFCVGTGQSTPSAREQATHLDTRRWLNRISRRATQSWVAAPAFYVRVQGRSGDAMYFYSGRTQARKLPYTLSQVGYVMGPELDDATGPVSASQPHSWGAVGHTYGGGTHVGNLYGARRLPRSPLARRYGHAASAAVNSADLDAFIRPLDDSGRWVADGPSIGGHQVRRVVSPINAESDDSSSGFAMREARMDAESLEEMTRAAWACASGPTASLAAIPQPAWVGAATSVDGREGKYPAPEALRAGCYSSIRMLGGARAAGAYSDEGSCSGGEPSLCEQPLSIEVTRSRRSVQESSKLDCDTTSSSATTSPLPRVARKKILVDWPSSVVGASTNSSKVKSGRTQARLALGFSVVSLTLLTVAGMIAVTPLHQLLGGLPYPYKRWVHSVSQCR